MLLVAKTTIVELSRIFNVSSDYLLCLDERMLIDISELGSDEQEAVVRIVECLKKK